MESLETIIFVYFFECVSIESKLTSKIKKTTINKQNQIREEKSRGRGKKPPKEKRKIAFVLFDSIARPKKGIE